MSTATVTLDFQVTRLQPALSAYFLDAGPGCFAFIGAANPERGLVHPHHSPRFDFDGAALGIGVQVLVRATERYLGS